MDFFMQTFTAFISLARAQLLEPLDGNATLPTGYNQGGVYVIMEYIQRAWPWLIGVGVGLVLLRIVIGGMEIMNSGGNPGLRAAAKDHIKWAIIGFLMLVMAGAILATINPSAYGVI